MVGPRLLSHFYLLSLCWTAFWFKANGPAMNAQERSIPVGRSCLLSWSVLGWLYPGWAWVTLTAGLAACSGGVRKIPLNYSNVPSYLLQCSGLSKQIRLKRYGAYCAVLCWNCAAERTSQILGVPPPGACLLVREGYIPPVRLKLKCPRLHQVQRPPQSLKIIVNPWIWILSWPIMRLRWSIVME